MKNDDLTRLTAPDVAELIEQHPDPAVWIQHLEKDLAPFWMKKSATELVQNLFPTYRTNTGEALPRDRALWPAEFKAAAADPDTAGLIDPDHNYIRAHSRQTFAYGIAFNMTGKPEYLDLCRRGAEQLALAFDAAGGMYTRQNALTGQWGEPAEERTSQDLAYGISGMGMYYYLTRDEKMLERILAAKRYIFDRYFDPAKGLFAWFPKERGGTEAELVSQLDQIYGYMMWLTPALPEPHRSQWKKELKQIAAILIDRFYSERLGMFWGKATVNAQKEIGTPHTDFGHSVKTFWLIHQIGMLTGKWSFVTFAREHIRKILNNAFIPTTGSWARRFMIDPASRKYVLDTDKEWWGLAELDQACAILAMNDPAYLEMLNPAYEYWFKYMVDREHGGEIFHFVSAQDNKPLLNHPKMHSWKTCFHSFEHALFGYITASQIKNRPVELHYAFNPAGAPDNGPAPYLFCANRTRSEPHGTTSDGRPIFKVGFNMVR
jgi:mannose/cellobiose epimerase-like protein (N-acyl-D-glucosamine 2-epimerase family)